MSTTTPTQINTQELSEKQKRFLAPFVKCTKDVFSMMLNWEVCLVGVVTNDLNAVRHHLSGIIGLSGSMRGSLVLSVEQEVALAAASAFLGAPPENVNADVIDTVGELTNMIGGSSKDRLGLDGVSIGLPTVVCGEGHTVNFDPGAHIEMLQFQSPHGPFTVEIALTGIG
jgi:chemotaxis protein CheX